MSYWNGRGGTYAPRRRQSANSKPTESSIPPLGAVLQSLKAGDLVKDSIAFKESAFITDCSFVASYNWLDTNTKTPTILVPGELAKSVGRIH
jgi:hypothetical protein